MLSSIQVLYDLVSLLDVSVDEFFLPRNKIFSIRKSLILDNFTDKELSLIEALDNGIKEVRSIKD